MTISTKTTETIKTVQPPPQEIPPGPIERAFVKIYEFAKKIFVEIGLFFSHLFHRNPTAPPQTTPPQTAPSQSTADLTPPPLSSEPIPEPTATPAPAQDTQPIKDLLDELRQWKPPQILLQKFNETIPEAEKKEIFERFGRELPLGSMDSALNRIWRAQPDVNQRYIQMGEERIKNNPRLLIPEIIALYPNLI